MRMVARQAARPTVRNPLTAHVPSRHAGHAVCTQHLLFSRVAPRLRVADSLSEQFAARFGSRILDERQRRGQWHHANRWSWVLLRL